MPRVGTLLSRYRLLLLAVLASATLHAAVFLGAPGGGGQAPDAPAILFSASLEGALSVNDATGSQPTLAPKPAAKPRARKKPPAPPREKEMIAAAAEPATAEPVVEEPAQPELPTPEAPAVEEKPEKVALAAPTAPQQTPDTLLPPEPFSANALPANVKITYALTSNFADGRAVYEWERDGDRYVISGEAEAVGFFTLFLEGRILQESRGRITEAGLRPERFVETKPGSPPEGLEFDWNAGKVTFDKGGDKRVDDLKDNTVDWLSMIFQLAARPPTNTQAFDMRVFTQRRLYQFRLRVMGEEEIEIPIGKVRALHLRHVNEAQTEFVDVWLGVDHHYMPVKMRYPVARNRLMVEQTAIRIVTQ
jgi:hypothetical protein